MRRSIVVIGALALLLTGCAEQHAAAPPATSTPPRIPASMSPSASAAPAPTTGAPALVHLTVHQGTPPAGLRRGPAWEPVSTPVATSTSVQISWADTPSPACGAVRDVWVRETSSSVVIDLVRGTRTAGIMCPALLVPRRAEVPLPSPLGSRVLQQDAASAAVRILPSPAAATPGTAG